MLSRRERDVLRDGYASGYMRAATWLEANRIFRLLDTADRLHTCLKKQGARAVKERRDLIGVIDSLLMVIEGMTEEEDKQEGGTE